MAVPAARLNGASTTVLAAVSPRRGWRRVAAVVSGLLLAAAFPSLEISPLAFVGLVPLLLAIQGLRPRGAFALGWLAGFVFYVATVYWVVYTIDHYTGVPLPVAIGLLLLMSSALACYTGGFAAGLRWFEARGLPALWLAPALWVTLEWLRGWFFIGFPWAALGYSQYRYRDLAQIVEVTGVYGLSAVVVLFNVTVAAVLRTRGAGTRPLLPVLVVLTVLVVGLPMIGRWRSAVIDARLRTAPAGTLRVGIAQGNVAQDQKWDPAFQSKTLARYENLTRATLAERPDLVVWPETAAPFFFQEPGPLRDAVVALVRETRVPLLFGSPAFRQSARGELEELNRAYLIGADGQELATYDKIQLVPFGEYVPFRQVLFFVDQIVVAVGRMAPGLAPTVLGLPGGRFGVLICYEGIFPALTRRFVADGADFLINITNDAWYGRTAAPYQHLAQVALRAIENRVPVVRAANTGISAVIDPVGRVRWASPLFETTWRVEQIAWPGVRTFYARFGDVFAWLCALATAVAFGYGDRRWRRAR